MSRGALQAQSQEVQVESTGRDGQAPSGEQLMPGTRPHAEAVWFSSWPPDGAAGVAGPGGPCAPWRRACGARWPARLTWRVAAAAARP